MNILVTGGFGYIGSHVVVELFESGICPIIVDNLSNSSYSVLDKLTTLLGTEPKFFEIDCRDTARMKEVMIRENIDAVIHFAAFKSVNESIEQPLSYFDNNINGLLSVAKAMQDTGIKALVFSSSCTVYGQPDFLPVTEDAPFKKATSPYGLTKQICEQILGDLRFISSICLRYFNPIGAHESGLIGELPNGIPNNLLPFITQTAIGKRSELLIFGTDYNTKDGTCVRDFIHVVDLAKAHISAIKYILSGADRSVHGMPLNIGTGVGCSVLELVHSFERVNGIKLNYSFADRRDGDIEMIFADPAKANELLKWKSERTIDQSVADAWRWELELRNQKF